MDLERNNNPFLEQKKKDFDNQKAIRGADPHNYTIHLRFQIKIVTSQKASKRIRLQYLNELL